MRNTFCVSVTLTFMALHKVPIYVRITEGIRCVATSRNIKNLYENDFVPTTENVLENISYKDPKIKQHTWDEVLKVLDIAVSKIEVRAVHGQKNTSHLEYHNIQDIDYNDYENGISVIAVGGNRLARGITLEGLSVSYYLRTTRLYDSLMQMGRWFGYRPGYVIS